jgi:hypothetical protein
MTVVIMNLIRGHKKCYFTILPTLIFEQFRQVPKFDRADLELAHKLTTLIGRKRVYRDGRHEHVVLLVLQTVPEAQMK